jgi:hypothetical protein
MEIREPVTSLVQDLLSAWNRGDATAFASLFTAEADYVTGAGIWLRGRRSIAELLKGSAAPPQVFVEGEPWIRDYGTVSSVVFRWATNPGIEPRRRGVVTCLLVKSAEAWRIDHLHNTDQI